MAFLPINSRPINRWNWNAQSRVKYRSLDSAALRWTATVVRQRRDVFDRLDRQAGRLQAGDGALSPRPRPLNSHFDFLDTELRRPFCTCFSRALCGKWGAFAAPLNPIVPAVAQHSTSPLISVTVTVVLLNVALMCAMARVTLRRTLRRLDFANSSPS